MGTALGALLGTFSEVCHSSVDLPEIDVADFGAFARVVDGFRPNAVINCAAFTDVDACETREAEAMRVNGEAPGMMAAECRARGIRFVHVGTDYVFDGTGTRPYREDDPPNPLSAYGRTKLAGEKAVLSAYPEALIVRTAWLYGAKKSFVRTIAEKARRGEALSVVNDQHGAPTSAGDLAGAIFLLLEKEASGLVHFVNAGETTWHGVARQVLDVLKLDVPLKAVTTEEYLRSRPPGSPPVAPRPRYSLLDTSLYTRITGKNPRNWKEALEERLKITS
ncbi:MAG: dTDP-4-dehydrorhamnose reductase [Deltaproteobacteria bacterium]|nr:dTDP-4-dehydrorhamnose reductase [Deltaproteobacteria bacterium]